MTLDIVVLAADRPDPAAMLAGMIGRGGTLRVRVNPGSLHVYDPSGPLLVSVETPVLVQAPGEVERLLGTSAPVPLWWVDIRAAAHPPEAQTLARRIADELVQRYHGAVWTS
jgi:hypothetical protein